MNVFSFVGNLGNDCKTNNVNGIAVCNFSVAGTAGYGDHEQTLWIDCALWGKRAETRLPEFLVKGQKVAVTGELGRREYEGKTYLTCRVTDVTLCGDKGAGGSAPQQSSPAHNQPPSTPPIDDSDVPF